MKEKQVTVKNLEVNYKIIGQGQPMLVLHGWGSSSDKWETVAQLLSEKNLQVIIPDLPGFGKSLEPKTAWNLDNYTDWLREFCESVPELNKGFYLLGHSFGGGLAVKFTVKYNQKVEKLFLVAAACVRNRTLLKKLYYRISKIIKVFSFIPYYPLARKAFYKFVIRKSDYIYVNGVMQETYLRVVSEDLSWRLPFVKVPTAIIWGDKDTLTPPEQADFINKKIPHSKLIMIPNGTHAIGIKVPEILVEKILEYI